VASRLARVPRRRTRRTVGDLVVAVVVLLASVIQAAHIHRVHGDRALWPGARTTQIPFQKGTGKGRYQIGIPVVFLNFAIRGMIPKMAVLFC
jgi:hypothetical protein